MIQIYYGYGKGKTTAAIGQGIRACGAGMSVSIVQFLKDCNSGELGAVDFEIFKAPKSLPFNPGREYQEWVDGAIDFIENCKSDMIILDEFLDAIPEFISEETAQRLMNKNAEIIITGHKEIKSLFEKADYITHMEIIKHPFDKGVKARKGIEF
jgi:cob(I)alamin adenosyltransferase